MSLVEAAANVVVGYGIAVLTEILVFPLSGSTRRSFRTSPSGRFSLSSRWRSYLLPRVFEAMR